MDKVLKLLAGNWVYIAVALTVYAFGVTSGVFLEDRLEAGKRAELQERVISLQDERSAIRDERDRAFRNLRDAENRLASLSEDAISEYETDNAEIDTLIASAIAELEANASPDCRATAADVERVRDIIQSIETVRSD